MRALPVLKAKCQPPAVHVELSKVLQVIDLHLFLIRSDAWLMSATTGGTVLLEEMSVSSLEAPVQHSPPLDNTLCKVQRIIVYFIRLSFVVGLLGWYQPIHEVNEPLVYALCPGDTHGGIVYVDVRR